MEEAETFQTIPQNEKHAENLYKNRKLNIKIIEENLEQREKFAILPTPIMKLQNLTNLLKGPNLYIKRDDNTGLALGGNKTRKLEYLIHHAIKNKNDIIITIGAPQSNHCRQTAAACAMYNIECHLVLVGTEDEFEPNGNILLDEILGAKIKFFQDETEAYLYIEQFLSENKLKNNPLFIPAGGSNIIGLYGYINAFKEIITQEKEMNINFDYIFFASSSYGTHGGLAIGNSVFSEGSKKIYGISICKSFLDSKSDLNAIQKIVKLVNDYNNEYGCDIKVDETEIILDERFNELGYGNVSDLDKEAMRLFARHEGIILDPVYSARAAGGMIQMIKNKEISEICNVLFIHTGGAPALFATKYRDSIKTNN